MTASTDAASTPLLAGLEDPDARATLRVGDRALPFHELRARADAVAAQLGGAGRAAVWATPTWETCVAVLGALRAGVPVVLLNPASGERELDHVLSDSAPAALLAAAGAELPKRAARVPRVAVVDGAPASAGSGAPAAEPHPERAALIVYTSGTTGPPKGVELSRRALAANLDALADAWAWSADDVLVHGLPLYHIHGLILGVLGPVRRGCDLVHVGRFSTAAIVAALQDGASMMFGVPTMYHRLAEEAERDGAVAAALGRARLLVSGSAALADRDHARLELATGQRVLQRYGMTETLITCAQTAAGDRRPGVVGPALPGVELRLVDDDGTVLADDAFATPAELHVRGPQLFSGYLNRPDATAEAMRDGWFATGDVAVREPDGAIALVGRMSTDIIKSGGYKIGAGEIEAALVEHPAVREAAVTAEPDADLGERIVAWVVAEGTPPAERELADHVVRLLAPHKRPRSVRYLDQLPRNAMGKVLKRELGRA